MIASVGVVTAGAVRVAQSCPPHAVDRRVRRGASGRAAGVRRAEREAGDLRRAPRASADLHRAPGEIAGLRGGSEAAGRHRAPGETAGLTRASRALLLLVGLVVSPAGGAFAQEVGVTALALAPSSDGAELTIALSGPAVFTDFPLEGPPRIVVDVQGARDLLPRSQYVMARGGVTGIRSSQFAPNVVRIVVDLERNTPYTASYGPEGIVVRLGTGAVAFEGWSSGTAPAAAGAQPLALPPAAPALVPAPVQEQPRISVNFHEADIRDVLASFAEFTGRSIVPGSGVTGSVTATIRNQPWDVALQTILRAYGLAAQELPSGIIQVDDVENLLARQTQEPLITQTFRINYVPVLELAASLETLRSDRGRIATNPSTNTLIITDVESVLADVRSILGQLDVRTPQVSIQARIIFVNRTDVEELGITYDLKDSRGSSLNRLVSVPDPVTGEFTSTNIVALGGNSIAALGNANIRVQQPQLEAVLSLVLGRHTLIAFIDALQSQELSDVQAAPLITTLDNQEAEIWVGERTPIRVVDLGTVGFEGPGAAAVPRATAELVETGIRLRVTPHITADRRILMQLHAERSSAQLAATDIGVIFLTQLGTTRLMVEDGETAVIAGLTVTEVAITRAGIPVLMNIPVIGALFRTTRSRELKRDLLIMVTPRIIEDRP